MAIIADRFSCKQDRALLWTLQAVKKRKECGLAGTVAPEDSSASPARKGSRATDDKQNTWIKPMLGDESLLAKVQKLEVVAKKQNCSMTQLALAWILRRKEVTSCIIGATRSEQVEENAAASGMKLDDSTIARVDEILSAEAR